jgi:MFS family permease
MTIFVCMKTLYSWSVFRKPLEDLFGIGATRSGWPYMLFLCFYALAMPFAGSLIERLGPERTTMIGGAILSAAWFLSGSATEITTLSLTYGVFGAIGVGLTSGLIEDHFGSYQYCLLCNGRYGPGRDRHQSARHSPQSTADCSLTDRLTAESIPLPTGPV